MEVRIYQPAKTAMQSGRAGTNSWILEFEPADGGRPDPLMGWSGSRDTRKQVRLSFDSEADAVAYARKYGLAYTIEAPKTRDIRPKSYSANFAYDRMRPWTH